MSNVTVVINYDNYHLYSALPSPLIIQCVSINDDSRFDWVYYALIALNSFTEHHHHTNL